MNIDTILIRNRGIAMSLLIWILACVLIPVASQADDCQLFNSGAANREEIILSQLISECASIADIGDTWNLWITSAMQVMSQNSDHQKCYLKIHSKDPPLDELNLANQFAKENDVNFALWNVSQPPVQIDPVDLLFIDSSLHLTYELETFAPKVRKYICMHLICGNLESEFKNSGTFFDCEKEMQSLRTAIADFLNTHPEWSLMTENLEEKDLVILKRNAENVFVYHHQVDYFLKNKIILCTGPSFGKYKLLKSTTEDDMKLIPFKKIFVATNDPKIMNITFENQLPVCVYIGNRGKQLDCLNCIIASIQQAVNDPDVEDDDIILFKHETVYINDMVLIKKAVSKILDGAQMVSRKMLIHRSNPYGTDAFFVRVSAIKEIIRDFPLVSSFPAGAKFCELYFTKYIVKKIKRIYSIPYRHSNAGPTELGFFHIASRAQLRLRFWDKANYDQLFRDE